MQLLLVVQKCVPRLRVAPVVEGHLYFDFLSSLLNFVNIGSHVRVARALKAIGTALFPGADPL